MADFPSYNPQSRTYTPGSYASIPVQSINGEETSVRRTNAAVGHLLTLTFTSDSPEQQNKIFQHYAVHNRFQSFDLPSVVLEGSGITLPTGYGWIYRQTPEVNYSPGLVSVAVELELVAPYEI